MRLIDNPFGLCYTLTAMEKRPTEQLVWELTRRPDVTVSKLAEYAGISHGTVSNLAHGRTKPSKSTLLDLTDAVNRLRFESDISQARVEAILAERRDNDGN